MAVFTFPPISVSTAGSATEAKQDTQITELQAINSELDTQSTTLSSLDGKDFATQTTLASIDGKDFATQTTLASIDGKDFATQTTLASIDGKDFSTETTLSALNAKVTAVDTTGKATEAKQDDIIAALELDVVDQIDATPVLDTSISNIPGNASLPLQVITATSARTLKIVSVEDIGEYIGLYTGPASSEVLKCVLPLGGGEIEVDIPASTRISLRAMGASAISTGSIALNMQG